MAGLVVVLDLIGPQKLREWGLKLQVGNAERIRRAQLLLKNWRKMPIAIFAFSEKVYESERMILFARDKARKEQIRREREVAGVDFYQDYPIGSWAGLVAVGFAVAIDAAMLVIVWHLITRDYTSNIVNLYWSLLSLLALYLLAKFLPSVVYALTELLLVGAGKVIDRVVVMPVAVTLATRRPGHSIRWIFFYVFVAGFMLDLLAS